MNTDYSRLFDAKYVTRRHNGPTEAHLLVVDTPLEDLLALVVQQDIRTYIYKRWEHLVAQTGHLPGSVETFTDKVVQQIVDSLVTCGQVQMGLGNLEVYSSINPNVWFNTFEAKMVDA